MPRAQTRVASPPFGSPPGCGGDCVDRQPRHQSAPAETPEFGCRTRPLRAVSLSQLSYRPARTAPPTASTYRSMKLTDRQKKVENCDVAASARSTTLRPEVATQTNSVPCLHGASSQQLCLGFSGGNKKL